MRNKIFQRYFASQSRAVGLRKRAERGIWQGRIGCDRVFWGGPQKSPPSVCSAAPPSADRVDPSPPAALPQGARGEGLRRGQRQRPLHLSSPEPSALRRLFLGGPQKSLPFLAPQKSQKSRSGSARAPVRRYDATRAEIDRTRRGSSANQPSPNSALLRLTGRLTRTENGHRCGTSKAVTRGFVTV